jgi:hypothetical protein
MASLLRDDTLHRRSQDIDLFHDTAESLLPRLPAGEVGCLYLDAAGKPVNPDPATSECSSLSTFVQPLRPPRSALPVLRPALAAGIRRC